MADSRELDWNLLYLLLLFFFNTRVDSSVPTSVGTDQTRKKKGKIEKKKKVPASDALTRAQRQKGRARGHAWRDADRASEALPSANTRQQEADPGQAREEPGCASNATWLRFHGERAVTDKVSCQKQGRACECLGKDAREQREP